MTFWEIFCLALALAMDAFLVCFSYGLVMKTHRVRNAFGLGFSTGLGQFLLPLGGFYLTRLIGRYVESCDHWLAFGVFALLGLKVIYDACSGKEEEPETPCSVLSFKTLALVGLATSIDAFVAGSSLYLAKAPLLLSISLIGAVTFVCGFMGFLLTKVLHHLPTKGLEFLAGGLLIGIGVKILMEHHCF